MSISKSAALFCPRRVRQGILARVRVKATLLGGPTPSFSRATLLRALQMAFPDTRLSLLQRLHDRDDSAAWTEFCAIYERVIYRIALRYGLQDADAREVSQEVLLVVSRRIRGYDPDGKGRFRSWLSTVARNVSIDLIRKARAAKGARTGSGDTDVRRHLESLVASEEESQLFDMESKREQFRWAADRVRSTVSDSTWQAFWSTAVKGEPVAAVADRVGLSVGSVYVARCRTLSKIRKLIEPFQGRELAGKTTCKQPSTDRPLSDSGAQDNAAKGDRS